MRSFSFTRNEKHTCFWPEMLSMALLVTLPRNITAPIICSNGTTVWFPAELEMLNVAGRRCCDGAYKKTHRVLVTKGIVSSCDNAVHKTH